MSEHRVPMLGASLHRYRDPAQSSDPLVRELVGQLATLEVAPAPRAEFRAELRAQLVAVAPRLIAEGPADNAVRRQTLDAALGARETAPTQARPARPRHAGVRTFSFGRPLAAAACTLFVFAALLGGAVWLGRNMSNGSLGSVAQAGNVYRAMNSNDTKQAQSELTAADGYFRAAASAAKAGHGKQVIHALNLADGDVHQAMQRLGGQSVRNAVAAPLKVYTQWSPSHSRLLASADDAMLAGAAHNRLVSSEALLRHANRRAELLMGELGCAGLNDSGSDSLGPLPSPNCTVSNGATQGSTDQQPPAGGSEPSAPIAKIPSSLTGAPTPTDAPAATGAPATATDSETTAATDDGSGSLPSGVPTAAPGAGAGLTPSAVTTSGKCTITLGSISLTPCALLSPHS